MNRDDRLEQIKKEKIVAIVRGISTDRIAETAKALEDGGIRCLEIAISQTSEQAVSDTMDSIRLLKETFGDRILLGAGTVLSAEQVDRAAEAGAGYMISPNCCEEVIRHTKEIGSISIPGAFTPSEAVNAYRAGADIVKMFPAGLLGTDYIKAVRGPLGFIPLMAVGGVTPQNAAQFLKAGACGVGVGGSLVSPKAIFSGNFVGITRTAKEFLANIRKAGF